MLERIDASLLRRADRFVGWNHRRGCADQWEIARAVVDISVALAIAGFIVSLAMGLGRFDGVFRMVIVLITLVFRSRQTTRIEIWRRLDDGATRWRRIDAPSRRKAIAVTAFVGLITPIDFHLPDVLVLLCYACFDASRYAMAALPPPEDREESRVLSPAAT